MFALKHMMVRRFSPHHTPALLDRTQVLTGFAESAAKILGGVVEVAVRKPCPLCGELFTHAGREQLRVFALVVSESGAWCRSPQCPGAWTQAQLPMLARLLEGAQ